MVLIKEMLHSSKHLIHAELQLDSYSMRFLNSHWEFVVKCASVSRYKMRSAPWVKNIA